MFSFLLLLFTGRCIKNQSESKSPILQGHRISGAYQQPFQALEYAIQKKYPSIEIDVSLTSDQVLIIHHDYWLGTDSCEEREETYASNRTFIKNHTWTHIQKNTACFTQVMSVEDLLSSSRLPSHILINLDIKYHPTLTQTKENFITALVDLISQHPDRKLMVTTSDIHIVQTLKKSLSIPIFLEYPFFPSSHHNLQNIMTALSAKLKNKLGMIQFVDLVRQSHADGISLPFQIVSLKDIRLLNKNKVKIQLFTAQTNKDTQKFCSWPIDILISDKPESAPCFDPLVK